MSQWRAKFTQLKKKVPDSVLDSIPETFRETALLRGFGLTKIPLIFYCSPRVIEMNERRVEVMIPLNWRTRNHLGSMYFGALAVGADVAGGILAMRMIQKSKMKVSLAFKNFKADFLKRAEGDVHFICEDGEKIAGLVERVVRSGERENLPVRIIAKVPRINPDEPVADFELVLSLKRK